MEETVPNEVKIIHIHKGKEREDGFIECINLRNGKTLILMWNTFIKRYGLDLINKFEKSLK